jgi:calcium-independent phospholipase A2
MVYLLTDLGGDPNVKSYDGSVPLHIMVKKDRQECVLALLVKGANAAALDMQGNSVLEFAILV